MNNLNGHLEEITNSSPAAPGKYRLLILKAGFIAFFVLVALRLIKIQVVDSAMYKDIAEKQYQSKIVLPSTRGSIFDRSGNVIASNSRSVSFAADPQMTSDDAVAIAKTFSKVFGKPKNYYLDKLNEDTRFVWLERQVDLASIQKLDLKSLPGVFVRYEPKRLYDYDHLAGQLIGSTDVDNKGNAGVELEYDKQLRGIDGYVIFQRDGKGRARPVVDYPRVEPQNGSSIYLTIDLGIQSIVEEELMKGVTSNKAEGGIAIVLDPHTGAVLALAQYPGINPSSLSSGDMNNLRIRAVTDIFEPGSVFKIVTTSAAIENDLIKPDQKFYAEQGKYIVQIGGGKTREIDDAEELGWVTFKDALAYSSNIVMAKASDIIGSEKLYRMARNYGFGIGTDVGLPGEVKGTLKKPFEWSVTSLNTIAFGYEVGVTPMQIAMAYGALANGGVLMKPYLLEKEVDGNGMLVSETQPESIRRVISEATAKTLTDFFSGVVDFGTAKGIKMANLKIAGKTGTSKKYGEGHYESGNYTASFVGFFPADNPKLVCLVMMDNPRGSSYYGAATSAPIFRAVAERIMNTTEILTPNLPENVIANSSATGQMRSMASARSATTDSMTTTTVQDTTKFSVPDVLGMSARKAVSLLTSEQFEPSVTGSGVVVSQDPPAGTPGSIGMKIALLCQPKSLGSLGLQ
jgi:cell division protein FtsI (penicillin-binding protein 3)